ncbi:MAG: VCBS repeat-containing protein [Deltaproteobacteria bacterium]|nr:VCBS repeat-containing protein [Deltaproteobacteria bacterium]
MPSTPRPPVHPSLHFDRFLSSTFCRAVARFLILTILVWDLPCPQAVGVAQAGPTVLYVNATDPTCQGQSPCYQTIQAAVDTAQPGDTVRVQAGEYDEALLIKKKQNLVLEADPAAPEGSVMLDSVSQRCGRGDVISIMASADITIRGFTITDAGGQAIDIKGGGLRKHNEHIVIERNRIFGNGTSKCQGGIRVGPGTPDTVILNNLMYGNGQDAINFYGGKGGPHYVVQNVIHGNRRDGVNVTKGQEVVIVNNLITHNGTDPKPLKQLFGVRRPAPKKKSRAENAQLLHNLICGNTQGELFGPMLDGLDAGNLTPTGSEGPGVTAMPQCADNALVYAHVTGPDGIPNTKDDDFTLAVGSPAVDAGIDPRLPAVDIPVATASLEQDFFQDAIRPGDGDLDGTPAFDMGAIEGPGPGRQCTGGQTQACYEGPDGTPGVGLCQAGLRTCQPDGTYGACLGQVLPQTEICGNKIDEDCNGQDLTCPPLNHPPDITSEPVTAATVGQPYTYDVNATDPDNDTLIYALTTFPTGMTINPDTGLIEWTPSEGQIGPQEVTVEARDPGSLFDTQSFTIQVAGVPISAHAPVALGNSYEIRADQILNVPVPGILGNDSDADDDPLTAVKLSDPTKGELSFNSNGGFTYTPNPAALVCTGTPVPTGVSFTEPLATSFATASNGYGALGLAKGDFNRDGAIDLAFTWYDNVPGVGERSFVSTMLGNGDGSFQSSVLLHTVEPRYARGILAKDVDNDGELDLVVAAGEARQLLLFRGQGNGSFVAPIVIATTHRPDTLQSADIDNDGKLDLMTSNGGDNSVSVLLGNGNGTFQSPTNYAAGENPTELAVGDVNGDLAPDLAVGSIAYAHFDVLLNKNDGSGDFQPAQGFNPRTQVSGLYLADFNGDRKLDVVVSGPGCGSGPQVSGFGCMVFIPGNGDGTFPTPPDNNFIGLDSDFPLRRFTENVTPDLNGDGKLDVIFLGGFQNVVNQAFVGLGNGDGTFAVTRYVMSPGPALAPNPQPVTASVDSVYGYPVVTADFNGDGVVDLATGNIGGGQRPGGVSLLPGATPGTFAAPRSFPIRFDLGLGLVARRSLALGDFTNDGQPELATLGVNHIGLVSLNSDGSLGPSSLFYATPAPGEFSHTLRTDDFDRDGNLDLLWLGTGGIQGGPGGRILVGFGDGTGHIAQVLTLPPAGHLRNSVIEDFNADGFPDFAVYSTEVEVYLSDGVARTFSVIRPAGDSTLGAGIGAENGMVAADFDGDGNSDIVLSIGVEGQSGQIAPQRSIFLKSNGDGTFQPGVTIASGLVGGIYDYAAGDLNHDGAPDLVGNGIYGNAHVQLGNGDGTFQAPVTYFAGTGGNSGTTLADFDRDGHLDIAITGDNYGWGFVVFSGKGDGTFDAGQKFAVGQINASDLAVMDLNSDGKPDVIVSHQGRHGNLLTVLLNNAESGRLCTHTDSFTYKANDGGRDSNTATVSLKIRPVNHAPVITSTPVTQADTRRPYFYDVEAGDSDGGLLTFALATAPFGMKIDPDTGVIRWLPASSQAGNYAVTVRVYDEEGLFDEQSFTLTVTQRVTVPNVVGQTQAAAETAILGVGLTVGAITTSNSATVPTGNVISQTPAGGVSAPSGSAVALVISLGPLIIDNLASILVEPQTSAILVGQTQTFTATGVLTSGASLDLTAVVSWASDDLSVATIAATGVATSIVNGVTTIRATASGVAGTAVLAVRTPVGGDTTAPTAAITSPVGGTEVTSLIDVIGTATDTNFFKYELAYAPAGETNFTLLTSGAASIINDVLGQFDPTVLINDLYDLKLTVFDLGGNETSAMVTVQVAREKKVGLFSITFQDLNIPLSGIPITVNRTYDSRDKRTGDFGVGWRLDIQTLRIRTNRILGTGWVRNPGSFATIVLSPTDQHKVSLTLPDGKVEEFDLQVSPTSGIGGLDFTNVVGFTPRPGTLGTLEALANGNLAILNAGLEDELVDDITFNTYNPQLFRYTTVDGTQIEIHCTEGVKKVTDRNGNTLTFGPNGIIHSAGKSVLFTRDAQNRITQITDPMGHVRTYEYDANGDLISATDFVGLTTQFAYNRTHGLLDIIDPTGARVARNEYDASGRLVATIDAQGHRVEFTHDLGASQEIVKDRLGNITLFEYDAVGNVVAKTDALGGLATYTHDSRGNELTQTDPLGRVATKTYDSRNNVLTSTDFDGNTTISTYNSRSQVLTTTDPEGHTTTNVYDAAGNLTQTTNPEGGVTQHTYDAAGNRLTATDPLGHVTTFTYDANGNLTSETDPLGTVTTFSYNANGSVVSSAKAGQTTQYQYDAAQRLTVTTDTLGHQTEITYSLIGDGNRPATTTDATGHVTEYGYNVRGNRIGTTFPDGSSEMTAYDAENRVTSQTNRDGHTTEYRYDALGRQTKVIHPNGTEIVKTYDASGRVLTQTDERGNLTSYNFAPNIQTVTDALGQVTVHEFDGLRRRVKTTDALGRVTTFTYDSVGNPLTTAFPNGTTKTTIYDVAGRKVAETNQAGQVVQFTYDLIGQLVQVTDAAGGVTSYTYNALGHRLTETDANGHTTLLAYDALGRLLTRIRPLGQQESFTYDGNGNLLTQTDFNGQPTTFTYDAVNHLTQKTLPGGSVVAYAFTANGLRTQAGGDTSTYDAHGRLTQETKASSEILTYTYDAAGNKTSLTTPQGTTTYTYDALNRLATVVDATGTTTYTYDAVGNLASTAYPNGVTTTYSYDTLNRLVQMTNSGPGGLLSSYTYTLGLAGNRLQVVEAGPATTGRTVLYSYDAVYRLTQEAIDEPGTVNDQTIAYTYDAVGNRTQMARNGTVTIYSYDANDRLTSETTNGATTTYTYDDNGSLLAKSGGGLTDTYTYDGERRLVAASVQSGADPGPVSYTYDADGMRTSKTAGGVTTTFLLDKNRAHAQVLAEVIGNATVLYSYGYDLIAQTRAGIETHFYQYDGQLSTRQLTNTAGTVTDSYVYDAFGVTLASAGSASNVYLYTGEQLDPNVGFYYLRARYYNQTNGRFVTTDPLEGNVFDPVSLHRYLYANGNPVDVWDPSGLVSVEFLAVIAILAFVAAFTLIPSVPHLGRSREVVTKAGLSVSIRRDIVDNLPEGTAQEFAAIVQAYQAIVFDPARHDKNCIAIADDLRENIPKMVDLKAFEIGTEARATFHEWAYVKVRQSGKKIVVLDPIGVTPLPFQWNVGTLPFPFAPVWDYGEHYQEVVQGRGGNNPTQDTTYETKTPICKLP